ncbi:class I SAM-dependent methyltransferase [Lentzea sp. BCCO 10_0856]|uniref:Class I SAM-dependent methyltransferase n=1 Tax=Lentzea miocenica TaxID=3095431 RepID=A0ABU4SW89_9PSEU|nr:class I SAM-dependent methyltransferase [Lentzea sp. BCCO 10_0856]MDX8030197.1 class I SAM-dependent methyltransferase [Lentzea sp. BCCO 10_0856]
MSDHGHGHGHGHGDQAEVLELDAEILAEHTASIIDWLPVTNPRHVVDLGSGTGAGTFALLTRFPEARVTAVDSSVEHLKRLHDKACEQGLTVDTVQADLDTQWPDLGTPDLVWASGSLHHLANPDQTLRQIHDTLAPGGVLAVIEMSGMPKFLPDNAPESHVEQHHHDERVPHRGADWGPKLTAAGFTVEGERTVTVHIERSPAVERYAHLVLRRRLDPEGLERALRRDDLSLRAERTVWAARKASA